MCNEYAIVNESNGLFLPHSFVLRKIFHTVAKERSNRTFIEEKRGVRGGVQTAGGEQTSVHVTFEDLIQARSQKAP